MEYVVSNNEELIAAVEQTNPGDVILLNKSETAYALRLDPYNIYKQGITFRSADPNDPAVFQSVELYSVNNLTFENLRFEESTAFGGADVVLHLRDSKNVTVRDSVMVGTGTEYLSQNGNERAAGNLTNIKYADGLTFENNLVSNFFFGVTVLESENVTISGNEFHSMQADPIQVAGVQKAYIENNYIHDLLGSDASINHLDMIQLWSTSAESVTQDLYIRNNILDSADGLAAQSIFLNNEQYGSTGKKYKNIVVTDNIIHNNDPHGITIAETDGVTIYNNTIVVNEKSYSVAYGEVKSHPPIIRVSDGSSNVRIINNVTTEILAPSGAYEANNLIANYDNPLSDNNIANNFVNPLANDLDILTDLMDLPGSTVARKNIGSRLLDFDTNPEEPYGLLQNEAGDGLYLNNHSFDLSELFDEDGRITDEITRVDWDFGDGKKMSTSELTTTHFYAEYGIYEVKATVRLADGRTIESQKTIDAELPLAIGTGFDSGVREASPHNMAGVAHGSVQFVDDGGSKVAKLSGGHIAYENTADFFNNREFTVVADFRKDNMSDWGDLFWFSNSFTMSIRNDALIASYGSDTGIHWINERFLPIDNTDWHRVVMTFDGVEKTASLYLDGEHIKTINNVGTSQIGVNDKLYIGSPYGQSFDGLVDNFSFLRGAMSADQIAEMGAAGTGPDQITKSFMDGEPFEQGIELSVSEPAALVEVTPEPAPVAPVLTVEETTTSNVGPVPQPAKIGGSIAGRIFVDANDNDLEDTDEAGVSGSKVELMSGGRVVATTLTDGDGAYSFGGLADGYYFVRFSTDAQGRDFIRGNVGGNDAVDSDVWKTDSEGRGFSSTYEVSSGTTITDVDLGLEAEAAPAAPVTTAPETPVTTAPETPVTTAPETPVTAAPETLAENSAPIIVEVPETLVAGGQVSGRYLIDDDNNDFVDAGETAVVGATVALISRGQVVATTSTDANGGYKFTGLDDGYYYVEFGADANGRAFVRSNVGGDESRDSDVWKTDSDGNGISGTFEISSTQTSVIVDAGVEAVAIAPPVISVPDETPVSVATSGEGKITGRFFVDNDLDGFESSRDNAVSGARVILMSAGLIVASTTTSADGYYGFGGLSDGHYYVLFEGDRDGRGFMRGNVGGNEAVDSDVWTTDADGNGISASVEISGGISVANLDAGLSGVTGGPRIEAATLGSTLDPITSEVEPLVVSSDLTEVAPEIAAPILATISEEDDISLQGMIEQDKLLVDMANQEIRIDRDNDGTVDEVILLQGEFSGGGFLAIYNGAETVVTFNKFIGGLTEGGRVGDNLVNGIENDLYLMGTEAISDFMVTIVASDDTALYSNSLGVYEYDESGAIYEVRLLAGNIKTAPTTFTVDDVTEGHKLGFFVIQNGYNQLDTTTLIQGDLGLDTSSGRAQLTNDGEQVLGSTIFLSHDAELNADGMEHVVSGLSLSGEGLQIGFEDQRRDATSDDDFQDIVLHIEAFDAA